MFHERNRYPVDLGYGRNLQMPSYWQDYKEDCEELYGFWIKILDEGIKPNERITSAENFFRDQFKKGNPVLKWFQEDDPTWGKPRAVLIKELAFQDWHRVRDKVRNNQPSVHYAKYRADGKKG